MRMQAIWNGKVIADSDETVVVDGAENADAAWFYPHPKPSADAITARIAFWKGSAVTPAPAPESADATDSAT